MHKWTKTSETDLNSYLPPLTTNYTVWIQFSFHWISSLVCYGTYLVFWDGSLCTLEQGFEVVSFSKIWNQFSRLQPEFFHWNGWTKNRKGKISRQITKVFGFMKFFWYIICMYTYKLKPKCVVLCNEIKCIDNCELSLKDGF